MKIVSVKPGKLPLKHFLDQEVTLLSFPPHGHAEMSGHELGKCTTHLVAWLTSPSSAPQLPRNSRWTTKIYPLDGPRGTFDLQEDLKEFWRIRGEKHLPWNLYRIVIEPAMESGKTPHLHKSGTSCSYCKCTVWLYNGRHGLILHLLLHVPKRSSFTAVCVQLTFETTFETNVIDIKPQTSHLIKISLHGCIFFT